MNDPRPEMACATCLAPLNILGDIYIHPAGFNPEQQHPAVPVTVTSLDTVRRTCDFCSDRYPIWTIIGGDLTAFITIGEDSGLMQNFGDRWATCATCYDHIAGHRFDRLVDRALRSLPTLSPTGRRKVAELHQSFLSGLRPGRTLITTTAWPATTTAARDLPKIRDRLVRFYRGPVTLPGQLAIDRKGFAEYLECCRLYWVDPTFTDLAATAAQSLPRTTVHPDLIPGDSGMLTWAAPVGDTVAITWSRHEAAVELVRYRQIGAGLDEAVLQHLREDVGWLAPFASHVLPMGTETDRAESAMAVVLATWLLMGQPAAEMPGGEIDKATRRRYARDRRAQPDIRLVRLRSSGSESAGASHRRAGAERAVPTSRVWVTGHWRNQPYGPGRALRRPVYIHPFLRGPDDAPIKLSTTVRVLTPAAKDSATP